MALWNGKDPILKERLFGLTNSEGNHGEDVKEYYFYLDSTPTHSYMKYLYKYPQAAYPYDDLVSTNRQRNRDEMEYELIDTGVFNDDRYFDVFVEYAKSSPEDILVQITVIKQGGQCGRACTCCRRCGSETTGQSGSQDHAKRPEIKEIALADGVTVAVAPLSMKFRVRTIFTAKAMYNCSLPKTRQIMIVSSARPTRLPLSKTGSMTL